MNSDIKNHLIEMEHNTNIKALKQKYRLAKEVLDKIFYEQIAPDFLDNLKPCNQPEMIFITGQQASGKSILSQKAQQCFIEKELQAIAFSRDNLRKYDPGREEIFATQKLDYCALTAYNASYWRDKLIEEAVKRKGNIVFESVLRNGRLVDTRNSIMIAKRSGYTIHCWSLAVHENISLYSMFNRYENQIQECGEGDVPPNPQHHDASYTHFPALVVKMIKGGMFDKSIIIDREGKEYYSLEKKSRVNNTKTTDNRLEQSFLLAMQKGRDNFYKNRHWHNNLINDWDVLIKRMEKRCASETEISMARSIMERCLCDSPLAISTNKQATLLGCLQ